MKLKGFLKNIQKSYGFGKTSKSDFRIVGRGGFSVVLNFDKVVYKLSVEKTYDEIVASSGQLNELKKQGVLVPEIFAINHIEEDPRILEDLRYGLLCAYSSEDYRKAIEEVLKKYDSEYSFKSGFYGVLQEKIQGNPCFAKRTRSIERANEYSPDELFRMEKTDPLERMNVSKIIRSAQKETEENLDFFNKIPLKHYEKFIEDGLNIVGQGIIVDNISKTNFLYDPNKGFYFIDLDTLDTDYYDSFEMGDLRAVWDFTFENVYRQICLKNHHMTKSIAEKTAQLGLKMSQALTNVYIKNSFNKKYAEAIQKYAAGSINRNIFKQFYESLGMLKFADSKKFLEKYRENLAIIEGKSLTGKVWQIGE